MHHNSKITVEHYKYSVALRLFYLIKYINKDGEILYYSSKITKNKE